MLNHSILVVGLCTLALTLGCGPVSETSTDESRSLQNDLAQTACASAGGKCVGVSPNACDGHWANDMSCGDGIGVGCCLPPAPAPITCESAGGTCTGLSPTSCDGQWVAPDEASCGTAIGVGCCKPAAASNNAGKGHLRDFGYLAYPGRVLADTTVTLPAGDAMSFQVDTNQIFGIIDLNVSSGLSLSRRVVRKKSGAAGDFTRWEYVISVSAKAASKSTAPVVTVAPYQSRNNPDYAFRFTVETK